MDVSGSLNLFEATHICKAGKERKYNKDVLHSAIFLKCTSLSLCRFFCFTARRLLRVHLDSFQI